MSAYYYLSIFDVHDSENKMKKLFSLLALVLLVVGCGGELYKYGNASPEPYVKHHTMVRSLYVDQSFTKQELAIIKQVVAEWNYTLNSYVVWKIEKVLINHEDEKRMRALAQDVAQKGDGIVMFALNHDNEMLEDIIDESDGVLAFVNGLGPRAHTMVVLQDRIGNKNLHKILLHEFGHSMGANHVNTESLMYPYYGIKQMDCIDKITAAQVATFFDLKLAHLNFCKVPDFE